MFSERVPRYRVYALIIGEILPHGEIFGCHIKKMSIEEQLSKGFKPIESTLTEEFTGEYKTYVTSLRYVDPLRIKSDYVVYCDFYDNEPLASLGASFRVFEDLCKYLFFTNKQDAFKKHGRIIGETYTYQVVKIYKLDSDASTELEVDYKINNGYWYLPNRPDANAWRVSGTDKFFQEASQFKGETFQKSLTYLYRSSVGHFNLFNLEKIALDHFKSVEVIINSLSKKKWFSDKLSDTANLINLTQEEQDRIKKLWRERSNGDVAHAKDFDLARWYPNQFPLPSGVDYSGLYPDSISETVLYKYYEYVKRLYKVEVNYDDSFSGEGELCSINMWTESNRFGFSVKKCNKQETMKKLRVAWMKEFSVKKEQLKVLGLGKNSLGENIYTVYIQP